MRCLDKYFQKRRILKRLDERSKKVDGIIRKIEDDIGRTMGSYEFLFPRVDDNIDMTALGNSIGHYVGERKEKLRQYRMLAGKYATRRLRIKGEISLHEGRYYVGKHPGPSALLSS